MKSEKFIGNTVGIVLIAAHGVENSATQPTNVHIEHHDFVFVVGVHRYKVQIKFSVYSCVKKEPILACVDPKSAVGIAYPSAIFTLSPKTLTLLRKYVGSFEITPDIRLDMQFWID